MANQTNSLAHTKWVCKYHVVFTPKYPYYDVDGSVADSGIKRAEVVFEALQDDLINYMDT